MLLLHLQRYWISSKSQHGSQHIIGLISCYCTYKGTEFLANHNIPNDGAFTLTLLLHLQRYWISSKSQHRIAPYSGLSRCYCTYKGTEFLANHNIETTGARTWKLLLHLQRYWISSKSQRATRFWSSRPSCYCTYKGTEFIANHNDTVKLHLDCLLLLHLQRYWIYSKSQLMLTFCCNFAVGCHGDRYCFKNQTFWKESEAF